jgi:hypothetical protein
VVAVLLANEIVPLLHFIIARKSAKDAFSATTRIVYKFEKLRKALELINYSSRLKTSFSDKKSFFIFYLLESASP